MSDSPNNTQKNSIDEEQAYLELCQIIAFALKTMDIQSLEINIAEWKRRYPVEQFTSEYKAKIKSLLSSEYLSLLQDYFAMMAKEFAELNQSKAYAELCHIVNNAKQSGELEKLQSKISSWQSKYPSSKFSDFYLSKIDRLTNEKRLEKLVEKFDQEDALEELKDMIDTDKSKKDPDALKADIDNWISKYPIKDFKTPKFKSEAETLTNNNYIESVIPVKIADIVEDVVSEEISPVVPESSKSVTRDDSSTFNAKHEYILLENILQNPHTMAHLFDWTYRNRNHISEFGDILTSMILTKVSQYYSLPKGDFCYIPKTELTSEVPTVEDTQNINEVKKETVTNFFSILSTGRDLLSEERDSFEAINKKSKQVDDFQEIVTDLDLSCNFDYPSEKANGKTKEPLIQEVPV